MIKMKKIQWIVWFICMGLNVILYLSGDREEAFLFLGIAIGLGLAMLLSPKEIIDNITERSTS